MQDPTKSLPRIAHALERIVGRIAPKAAPLRAAHLDDPDGGPPLLVALPDGPDEVTLRHRLTLIEQEAESRPTERGIWLQKRLDRAGFRIVEILSRTDKKE